MNVNVMWDTPDRKIIRLSFQRRWTRDGFHVALDETRAMLDSAQQATHLIIDQTGIDMPASVFLSHAKLLSTLSEHPQAGAMMIVGASEETRALCEMVSYRNTLCHAFRFADSLDDAYAVLSQLDFVAGLNDLIGGLR